MKFRIPPQEGMSLAEIFAAVEANKLKVDIAEYSIGQTTLEQIFLHFANEAQAVATANASAGLAAGAFAGVHYQQPMQQPEQLIAGPRGFINAPPRAAMAVDNTPHNPNDRGYQPPLLLTPGTTPSDTAGKTNL